MPGIFILDKNPLVIAVERKKMKSFFIILIAFVLVFSVCLTVFSIVDRSFIEDIFNKESTASNVTVKTTAKTTANTTKATVATTAPDYGFDSYVYLSPSGYSGYSIIDGTAFFFVKRDYNDVDFQPAAVYFNGKDITGYKCNVRVSNDGLLWEVPSCATSPSAGYSYCNSFYYSSIYVSYCMVDVDSQSEAAEIYENIKIYLTDAAIFSVNLSHAVGDVTGAAPNGGA